MAQFPPPPRPAPPTLPPTNRCVGREPELATIDRLFTEAVASRVGHLVAVSGPGGIGKSRLLQEAQRRLRRRGAVVLEGRCGVGGAVYQPFIELVAAAVRMLSDGGEASLAERGLEVLAALRGRAQRLAAAAWTREILRSALFERVAGFLEQVAAASPLALFVHDLHLADGATRDQLTHLVQTRFAAVEIAGEERLPALLVVSSRDGDEPWLAGVACTRLPLAGLDADGMRELLASPEVVEHFLRVTGGRPRALEALLAAPAIDVGLLFRQRVEALSPAARELLDALALLGEPVPPELLAAAGAQSPGELGAPLAELAEARFTARLVVDGELRFGLDRATDVSSLVDGIDPLRRRCLHDRIGRHLLRQGGDGRRIAAAEHLVRGSGGEGAFAAVLEGGERLEQCFANDRAIALYEAARQHAATVDEHEELDARLVELGRLVGDYGAALAAAGRMRQRAPRSAAAHRRLGQLHSLRDDFAAAREHLAVARGLAEAVEDRTELARIAADWAEVCFLEGRPDEARAVGEPALAVAQSAAPIEAATLRLAIRNTLGKVHLAEGSYSAAERLFRDNLVDARGLPSSYEEARALINIGIARLRHGDLTGAAGSYQEALQIAGAADDHRHRAICLQNLGVLAHWRCEYGAALRYFHDAVAAFKKLGQRGRLAWLALDLASLHLDLGDSNRAGMMFQLAGRLDGAAAKAVAINRLLIAGRLARAAADQTAAREHLSAARELARAAGNRDRHAEATLELGRLELEAGDLPRAELLVAELPDEEGAPLAGPGVASPAARSLLIGELAAARADLPRARHHLQLARDIASRRGDLEREWRAHFALARLAERTGDRAEVERRQRSAALLEARLGERVPPEHRPAFANDPLRLALAATRRTAAASRPAPLDLPTAILPAVEPAAARYARIVGRHPKILQLFSLLDRVAPSDSTVLLRGESGTGKELVANALHEGSPRASGPLVKVNCGAIVETLLLSELFGHERGAFTGAVQRKKGRFEVAHGGTIFLDEIGDVSPRTQVALLRVLQERQFERIGSTVATKVDVRIVCATHRDLEGMVSRGEFREDLYYRLKGIEIEIPALRDRIEDLPLLSEALLARIAAERGTAPRRLAADALELLSRYPWPGNVRELDNVLRSVSLFADGEIIGGRDFADYNEIFRDGPRTGGRGQPRSPTPAPPVDDDETAWWRRLQGDGLGLRELQERIEIDCIRRALTEAGGNVTRAAELLKMKRPRLSQLIKEHGLAQ